MKNKLIILSTLLLSLQLNAQIVTTYNSADIQVALQKLNTLGSVLYIAAHPDDENTRLLSYMAKERNMRTAYLSLTRGDGGQNLVGSEQGELLGLIRTQELLAARRVDGAEQFFTRANDFGYSKNPEETFKIWGKEAILADVVWVIRNFKPDVIITRFPNNGDGGHGHHTASALLAEEAFEAAADPKRFPEQLAYVQTWQAKRICWNSWRPQREKNVDVEKLLKLDAGVYNPYLGKSYNEIAAESRSMHKSQGFGSSRGRGSQPEYLEHLKGVKAEKDIMEGIETSWKRITTNDSIGMLVQKIIAEFKPATPYTITPQLIKLYKQVNMLPESHYKTLKLKEIENLIITTSGVWTEAFSSEYMLTQGKKTKFTLSALNRSPLKVQLLKVDWMPYNQSFQINKMLDNNIIFNKEDTLTISDSIDYSNPYWLAEEHTQGLFTVKDQKLVGKPENNAPMGVGVWMSIEGLLLRMYRPVMYRWTDPIDGELYRNLEITPELTLNFDKNVLLCVDNKPKSISASVRTVSGIANAQLNITLPAGWKTEPVLVETGEIKAGQTKTITFSIIPTIKTADNSTFVSEVSLTYQGKNYNRQYKQVNYKHIPVQTLFPLASLKLVTIDVKHKKQLIGYIPGAGDDVPEILAQLGYSITVLDEAKLKAEKLDKYQTIITGIRAYNTNEWIKNYQTKLMDYVKNGGTMLVQYNTSNFVSSVATQIGPYPFKVSRERVTEEDAAMKITDATSPLVTVPNKITEKDFDNWIQERGLYFAGEYGTEYKELIECNDTGEKAQKGSTIYCKHGKGTFIYTGLAFWRQLPAGVPGATRLMVNMIEAK